MLCTTCRDFAALDTADENAAKLHVCMWVEAVTGRLHHRFDIDGLLEVVGVAQQKEDEREGDDHEEDDARDDQLPHRRAASARIDDHPRFLVRVPSPRKLL
ncbi:hypothetical protein [Antrihabitans sp. YC2-6]|uniref:hypothetical protein n=1 Tax=Antrihabitans sp. YC2-6 TaxID=2799498 RepID=UPI001F216B97|nr:hypothetical protein [Antrihabitans sp. YC2-6]